jgi:hypothetical protein
MRARCDGPGRIVFERAEPDETFSPDRRRGGRPSAR